MTVCIIVPVLNRPQNVAPLIKSVAAATPGPYRLLFVVDHDDHDELDALERADADHVIYKRTDLEPGTYARKINLGYRESSEPLLFMAADDVRFHNGWLEHAAALVGIDNGKARVQVVGTNDLGNARTIMGEHSTHTLFTRAYIDTQGGVIDKPAGHVLCELYPHEYTDDEFVETAKSRLVYAHSFFSHVEHLHYSWGKGEDDDTYRLGRSRTTLGRGLYRRRSRMWRGPRRLR